MQYLKNDVFDNLVVYELNRWGSQYGAGRAEHEKMLGGRIWDACQKYGIKNMLALFSFGVTRTLWFSTVPRDRAGQIEWAEKITEEFSRVGDIRLMSGLTLEDIKTMELVWKQAADRLNTYVANKKPVEPKLPTKPEPIEQKKNEEPKQREEAKAKPEPSDQKSPEQIEQDDKKTMWRRLIGSIAGALSFVVDKIPIPLPIKYVVKIILTAIATFFK